MSWRLLHIPRYTGKDGTVLLSSMLPLTVFLNLFLYGKRYWTEADLGIGSSACTFAVLAGTYLLFTRIGVLLADRFPGSQHMYRRMTLALSLFLLSDFVILSLLLRGYDYYGFFGYHYQEGDFVLVYCFSAILTVFLTFLNEGIARFERYKNTLVETEQLRHTYLQSQLLGLKSQVNPHFLFNSLNTLSSLIPEDAAAAEAFLDELCKVYRYLLRNNDDYLVPLDQELSFLRSYAYLLQERYGPAFQLETDADEAARELLLPPLTLQFLFEDILEQNSFSRDEPLRIHVRAQGNRLVVEHNQRDRIGSERVLSGEAVLDNLREKFQLLVGRELRIEGSAGARSITVPLINEHEHAWTTNV
ncbi:sensor histidine kinase [Flaviaesturariibacter terrae]